MNINTLEEGGQVKKYHVAILSNAGTSASPSWIQISKSTDNTITMNAETVDRDFIVDTSATTILDRYKPSLNEPITLFKGEEDYEFFWEKFYNMATGDDAMGEVLVVFMNEESGDEGTTFKAWKSNATFVCSDFNPVESTLTFDINFNGTVAKGTATVTEGVVSFTAA